MNVYLQFAHNMTIDEVRYTIVQNHIYIIENPHGAFMKRKIETILKNIRRIRFIIIRYIMKIR